MLINKTKKQQMKCFKSTAAKKRFYFVKLQM